MQRDQDPIHANMKTGRREDIDDIADPDPGAVPAQTDSEAGGAPSDSGAVEDALLNGAPPGETPVDDAPLSDAPLSEADAEMARVQTAEGAPVQPDAGAERQAGAPPAEARRNTLYIFAAIAAVVVVAVLIASRT